MLLFSSLNLWLFTYMHALAGQSMVLDYTAIFFADYVQYVIAVWFIFLVVYPENREKHRTLVVVATVSALAARFLVKPFILLFVAEPRPYVFLHFVPLISAATGEEFQSFPSGHALFFFALAMTTYLYNKKFGMYVFLAAILMGFSRVYTGVHWPLDILGGALLGIGVGIFTYGISQYLYRPIERWILIVDNYLQRK